jgi:hypothetical protein
MRMHRAKTSARQGEIAMPYKHGHAGDPQDANENQANCKTGKTGACG